MINFPSNRQLQKLKGAIGALRVSLYIPYIPVTTGTNPNLIKLKTFLKQAKQELTELGATKGYIEDLLKPAKELVNGTEFWPSQRAGLALFMGPDMFSYYHIPESITEELVIISDQFELEPLIMAMNETKPYFLLTIGHKNVRLYHGTRYKLKPVRLRDFPPSLTEALQIDEFPQGRQTHTISATTRGKAGKGSEGFHEQYNVAQTDKQMLLEFFRRIDKRLHRLLTRHGEPLVVAGVNYLVPIYRKANTYSGLLSDTILGNQDVTDEEVLRTKAWRVVGSNNV